MIRRPDIRSSRVDERPLVTGLDVTQYSSNDISRTSAGVSQQPPRKKATSPPKTTIKRRQKEEPDDYDVGDTVALRTGMDRKGSISANNVIKALKETDGMVTLAAQKLRVSYHTLSKYIKNNKRVQQALYTIEQNILDRVQGKLMRMIEKGEKGNSSAVFFFLKCKGKERGFIESVHHITAPTKPITFKYQLVLPEGYKQPVPKQIEDKVIDITEEKP